MEFKIGDKVRCIKPVDRDKYGGSGWDLNKVFIIDREGEGPCYFPKVGDGVYGTHLELVNPKNLKEPTHLVIWNILGSGDPHRFFRSEKEAKDFMKELSEKDDVVQDSVILVAIKSVQQVSVTRLVRFKNYKI